MEQWFCYPKHHGYHLGNIYRSGHRCQRMCRHIGTSHHNSKSIADTDNNSQRTDNFLYWRQRYVNQYGRQFLFMERRRSYPEYYRHCFRNLYGYLNRRQRMCWHISINNRYRKQRVSADNNRKRTDDILPGRQCHPDCKCRSHLSLERRRSYTKHHCYHIRKLFSECYRYKWLFRKFSSNCCNG